MIQKTLPSASLVQQDGWNAETEPEQTPSREEICVMENGAEGMDSADIGEHVDACYDDLRVRGRRNFFFLYASRSCRIDSYKTLLQRV